MRIAMTLLGIIIAIAVAASAMYLISKSFARVEAALTTATQKGYQ